MNNGVQGKLESYIKFKYVGVGWSEDILSVQYVYIILVTYVGRDAEWLCPSHVSSQRH